MPTFTTSIKLLAATEKDYELLDSEMTKKSFHPADKPKMAGHPSENRTVNFRSNSKTSILDATTDVSTAVSSLGRKFTFTIMKEK